MTIIFIGNAEIKTVKVSANSEENSLVISSGTSFTEHGNVLNFWGCSTLIVLIFNEPLVAPIWTLFLIFSNFFSVVKVGLLKKGEKIVRANEQGSEQIGDIFYLGVSIVNYF